MIIIGRYSISSFLRWIKCKIEGYDHVRLAHGFRIVDTSSADFLTVLERWRSVIGTVNDRPFCGYRPGEIYCFLLTVSAVAKEAKIELAFSCPIELIGEEKYLPGESDFSSIGIETFIVDP